MKTRVLASILGLALLALFSGCATISPEQLKAQVAQLGYGADLAPGWQEKIKSFMELQLKDPASAIYKFGQPEKGYLTKPPVDGGGVKNAGYLVSVLVNAKNSYGGYTGFEEYKFLFRDNQIVDVGEFRDGTWFWQ